MRSDFPDYGMGVGLRPAHFGRFVEGPPAAVSWVEVISENFMDWESRRARRPLQQLERICSSLPVALHGVSLSIGSTDPLDLNYLKRLKDLVDRMEPCWVSDHLCWTGVGDENLHDLYPVPFTRESLNWISERIRFVQDFIGRRILIENVSSYIEFEDSEMSEAEFLRELTSEADCGLLLDINNVYVSSVNHGFDARRFIEALPHERVGQLHLAGHSKKGGFLIDTHDAPVVDEVWDLYRYTAERVGPVSTMIERDANIPEWEELELEIVKARAIRALALQESRDGKSRERLAGNSATP